MTQAVSKQNGKLNRNLQVQIRTRFCHPLTSLHCKLLSQTVTTPFKVNPHSKGISQMLREQQSSVLLARAQFLREGNNQNLYLKAKYLHSDTGNSVPPGQGSEYNTGGSESSSHSTRRKQAAADSGGPQGKES